LRQTTLDEHIRSRIQNEVQRLREEEETVRNEIQTALEKEVLTLDGDTARSRTNADDGEPSAPLNSIVLLGDVEEVKQKVDRYHSRAASESVESIKNAADSIVTCYK
jgi:altered-inheritance-of-mitochondria protein 13